MTITKVQIDIPLKKIQQLEQERDDLTKLLETTLEYERSNFEKSEELVRSIIDGFKTLKDVSTALMEKLETVQWERDKFLHALELIAFGQLPGSENVTRMKHIARNAIKPYTDKGEKK